MRFRATGTLLVIVSGMFGAPVEAQRAFADPRLISLTAGVGNSMGWFGVQGERYFADERLSVFVGMGYTPRLDRGDPNGPTFAAGLRSFTAGAKHRAFVEGAVSQVMVQTDPFDGSGRLYGPGLQGGYQYVSFGGFTFMASLGVGYALAVPHGMDPWGAQVGVGFGYTWRRAAKRDGPLDRRTR